MELQPNGVLYKTNATGELRHVEADVVLLATGYRRSKRSSGDKEIHSNLLHIHMVLRKDRY